VGVNKRDCPRYKIVRRERTIEDCVDVVECKVRVGKSAAFTRCKRYKNMHVMENTRLTQLIINFNLEEVMKAQ